MNEDDHRARLKEREIGIEAQRIFDSPVWKTAYEQVAGAYLGRVMSPATTPEETLEAKAQLLALHRVKRDMESMLITGQMATEQLEAAKDGKRAAGND